MRLGLGSAPQLLFMSSYAYCCYYYTDWYTIPSTRYEFAVIYRVILKLALCAIPFDNMLVLG